MSWHHVPGAENVGDEESIAVEVAGKPVALCRSRGTLHAVHNVCTHQFALLSDGYVEDGCIECPLHQGRFSLETGAPLGPPVSDPIAVYEVRIENGKTFVRIPDSP
jgi:nitrite reductase/ring-hydroxylating ferredoxin subunit